VADHERDAPVHRKHKGAAIGDDQLEVAARVVTADCGTRLSAKRLTPQTLREKVREAATKADGARRVAAGFAAAGGAAAGADAVEGLLQSNAHIG